MSPRTELFGALLLTALVLVAIHLTTTIDLSFSAGLNVFTGPRGYPGVILGAMLILALILVTKSARRLRAEAPGPATEAGVRPEERLSGKVKAALAYLALGLFVMVLEPLGYILAMLPLLIVISVLSGARRWSVATLVSFAMTLVCLLAFRYGLDTVLPEGIFGIDMIF